MRQDIERSNWLDFACIILALAGFFNVIDGIAAIRDSSYVANQVLFANLHAWGWFFWPGAFFVVRRRRRIPWRIVGVILAILVAFFNAIGQLVGGDVSGLVGHDPGAGCDRHLRPRHERSVGQRPQVVTRSPHGARCGSRATTSRGRDEGYRRRNSRYAIPPTGIGNQNATRR